MVKTLTWFVGGSLDKANEGLAGAGLGKQYRVDGNYRPVALRLYMGTAPRSDVLLDVRDDGATLFDTSPQMDALGIYKEYDVFKAVYPTIAKNSYLTLALTSAGTKGSGRDLTVELDLEPVSES